MLNVLAQAVPVFDWTKFGVTAIEVLVPVVTTVAIWAGRALLMKTPRVLIPIAAVALGTVLDLFIAYVSGGVFNPVVGALLGASAVWFRELVNTYAEHGLGS
jgi:hypothetical protein